MKMKVICEMLALSFQSWYCPVSAYLETVLQLRDERVLADEGKELSLDGEWHGDDEGDKDDHLEDEKSEDL